MVGREVVVRKGPARLDPLLGIEDKHLLEQVDRWADVSNLVSILLHFELVKC